MTKLIPRDLLQGEIVAIAVFILMIFYFISPYLQALVAMDAFRLSPVTAGGCGLSATVGKVFAEDYCSASLAEQYRWSVRSTLYLHQYFLPRTIEHTRMQSSRLGVNLVPDLINFVGTLTGSYSSSNF